MRRTGLLVLVAAMAFSRGIGAQVPIIDMHLHAFSFDEYGAPPPPNEVTGAVPPFTSNSEYLAALRQELRANRIVRAVASGRMDRVTEWRGTLGIQVLGGAYTGPRDPLPAVHELRQAAASGDVSVLGELGLQYRGLDPNTPELAPYWRLAEELGLPVGVHTGLGDAGTPYGCCPNFRARLGDPLLYEDVLVTYPELKLYLMHGGYPYLAETKALLTIYPQVYVDIAVIDWAIPQTEFHDYLEALVRAGFEDRIMFGSDQMVWPEAISLAVRGVESAGFLSDEQRRAIFYDNAARFLSLTAEQIAEDHQRAAESRDVR